MSDYPLLMFPEPEVASRSTLGGGSGHFARPSHQRQGARLAPIFNQLQEAFNARRAELQQTIVGVDPEQVLVIETIGSVDNFANAIRRIEGLEWMGEIAVDDIPADEDFYDEEHPDRGLSGRLYLVMSNQRALEEMLSLWRRYNADPNMEFARGYAKFRDVFLCLKDIRRWDVQDRLLETGVLDVWQENLELDGDTRVRFEAELWYRGTSARRQSSQEQVINLIEGLGGQVLNHAIINEIAYHSVLAELPRASIQTIIDNPAVDLVRCDEIMFFRPVGQMCAGEGPIEGELLEETYEEMPLPTGQPIIAILDGLPLANHRLLSDRLIIDDPDDWADEYPAAGRVHGTYMASLVAHGDLTDESKPLTRPIYVRPIMRPDPNDFINDPRRETVPENVLAVDLIHKTVRRLFENDGDEEPVAPTIKIINLSIGDPSRQFAQTMSPLSRLIDWLSYKYNVLFIISAGNHNTSIPLGITSREFEQLDSSQREEVIIRALYHNSSLRRLLSPAESINGITVGSVQYDQSDVPVPGDRFDPFEEILPSPISAFGSGHRRAIKPDVVFTGGRQWYRLPILPTNPVYIEPAIFRSPPGNKVASPGTLAGELTSTAYCCGTSNATALITRGAGMCYESLIEIINDQLEDDDLDAYKTCILKAMVVHGCSWGDVGDRISNALSTPENGRQLIARWLGYGIPQIERVLACTQQRATILGFGQLTDGEANLFQLPLPPSLSARPEWRRLTVTLSWLSPTSPNTQKYRNASLWFEVINNSLTPRRSDADWQAVRRGTVQHEVFEGRRAEPFIDGDVIQIKVNCRTDAGRISTPISYGIVVTLEVSEGIDISIYNEIRTRIAPVVQIRPTTVGRQ